MAGRDDSFCTAGAYFFDWLFTSVGRRHTVSGKGKELQQNEKGGAIMQRLIVKNENIPGRRVEVQAQKTYETDFGAWIAELEGPEFRRACLELCSGMTNCSCENMHGEMDLDDDGKEYRIVHV